MDISETSNINISVGEALVKYLEQQGVSVVFGIPGVHTVELYRGLAASGIRHITPRHEQGAGFMADGYARTSGKPGVAFIITGPGITNILTPMGQALADNVSILVISSVNEGRYLGKGQGHLHELPDQHALCSLVALRSEHIGSPDDLLPALDTTFTEFSNGVPGPRHIQIPMDVMGRDFIYALTPLADSVPAQAPATAIQQAQALLNKALKPLILVGGGSLAAEGGIVRLAECLNAPVVQTVNARGLLHKHPLRVPASPSLTAVRELIAEADLVLAIGTELGPTDYDIYHTDELPAFGDMIRIDIDPKQLGRHDCKIGLCGDAAQTVAALLDGLAAHAPINGWGAEKAAQTCTNAFEELSPDYQHLIRMTETIRDTLPGSIIVGDSTQLIYAANMYYGHDHAKGWFNTSVGFGALGFAIPAAMGAQLAEPGRPVICISGDGGAQFTLPELMVAVDEKLLVIFIIWNNGGYQEIETSMAAAGVEVVGCDPTPPDFKAIAQAYGIPYLLCENTTVGLASTLSAHCRADGPILIEIEA